MVKNRWLLSSVAFSVSFGLSLLFNQGINKAFVTGLFCIPATFLGVVAVNRKQRIQEKFTFTTLQRQIHQLENWERQLDYSVASLASEEQGIEENINSLQAELHQLYLQTSEQKRYKQQLSQDLIALSENKQHLEAESQRWINSIRSLEQQKGELDLSVRSLKAEKHTTEVEFKQLEQEVILLQRIKPQLELKSYHLQTEIQQLENRQTELTQSLSKIAAEQQTIEFYINAQKAQINQIVEHESTYFQPQEYQIKSLNENPHDEWSEFASRLQNSELQVLKAIAQQDNPNAAIKNIAESNITMPELLIAAINEHALATIGDLIIEPGSVPPVIAESDYLTSVKKMLKINEVN